MSETRAQNSEKKCERNQEEMRENSEKDRTEDVLALREDLQERDEDELPQRLSHRELYSPR